MITIEKWWSVCRSALYFSLCLMNARKDHQKLQVECFGGPRHGAFKTGFCQVCTDLGQVYVL